MSADFRLPDLRGEGGSKTEVGYSPGCEGNNRRNIWSLGHRTRNEISSTVIPECHLRCRNLADVLQRGIMCSRDICVLFVFCCLLSFIFFMSCGPVHLCIGCGGPTDYDACKCVQQRRQQLARSSWLSCS